MTGLAIKARGAASAVFRQTTIKTMKGEIVNLSPAQAADVIQRLLDEGRIARDEITRILDIQVEIQRLEAQLAKLRTNTITRATRTAKRLKQTGVTTARRTRRRVVSRTKYVRPCRRTGASRASRPSAFRVSY